MTNKLPSFLTNKNIYLSFPYLILDFETTSLEFGSALNKDNQLLLACWTVVHSPSKIEHKYKFGSEFEQQELLADLRKSKFVVAQNCKFEAQWLARCGVDLHDLMVADTFLAEWVINGNIKKEMNLRALARAYNAPLKLDLVSEMIDAGVPVGDIPKSWLLEYCQRDVEATHHIFKKQLALLTQRKQLHIWHVRNLTCTVLADIEANGMQLDKDRVNEEYERVLKRRNELEAELSEFCGGINLASPPQVADFLYDKLGFEELKFRGKLVRTATGRRKADADTLASLVPKTDDQRRFTELYKEFRNLDSLLSKNLSFFKGIVDERDGLFFASLNQGRTGTHRLASSGRSVVLNSTGKASGVQFQNLPRQYKRLFRAITPDWILCECDGSQLEFRVAAALSEDKVALAEIRDGVDVHTITKDFFTQHGEPISRQDAKPLTFKPTFGGEGITRAEKAYCKFFRKKYKGLDDEQHRWATEVLNSKKLRTPLGMIYFWPNCKMEGNYGRISHRNEIYNYPIQGTATGEIIPIALVHFWHRVRGMAVRVLNTVHDSILSEFPPELKETVERIAQEAMTTDVYKYLKDVYEYEFKAPLGVGIKMSEHWGDTKNEVSYNVEPTGEWTRSEK